MKILSKIAYLSGFSPFNASWRWYNHRVFHVIVLSASILMTIYSICAQWPNVAGVIKVSMALGIFTQSTVKGILNIVNGDVFTKLLADVENMYENMEIIDEKREKLLQKCIKLSQFVFRIMSLGYCGAVSVYLIYPFFALLYLEEQTLMFPFYCPFVDHSSTRGFIVNSIIHGIFIIYTLLFHNFFDSIFAHFVMQVIAKVELLKIDLDSFQEYLLNADRKNPEVQENIKRELRNIIKSQKEVDLYIENLGDFFLFPSLVTVASSIFSVCISLVCLIIINWFLAYGSTFALSGQLFINFCYGTIVYHQLTVLNKHFYDFPWYLLDAADQKAFILMITKTHRPINLELLFIGPFHMETFTKVNFILILK